MTTTETSTKGRGFIRIQASLWDDLGKPKTPDAWHKSLLLPDSYTIYAVDRKDYEYSGRDIYWLFVQHELLPLPPFKEADPAPEVIPYYSKIDGKAVLDHIEIWAWERETFSRRLFAVTDRRQYEITRLRKQDEATA